MLLDFLYYTIILSVNDNVFFLSNSFISHFSYLIALTRTSRMLLNRNSDCRTLVLFILKGKFYILSLTIILDVFLEDTIIGSNFSSVPIR